MTDRSNVIGAVHYPITSNNSGRELIRLAPSTPKFQARAAWAAWNVLRCFRTTIVIVIVIVIWVFWPIMCFFSPLPHFRFKKGCMWGEARTRTNDGVLNRRFESTGLGLHFRRRSALTSKVTEKEKGIPISRLERLTSSSRKQVTSDALYQLS